MTLPVWDWAQTVDGLNFYPQDGAPGNFFYGNWFDWGELQKNTLGGKITIIHAELKLGPPTTLLAKAKTDLGANQLRPLVIQSYANRLLLRHDYHSDHRVEIKSISSFPFETVVLTASVNLELADGAETVEKIEERWSDRSIFEGSILSAYRFLRIMISKSVSVEVRNFRDQVFGVLGDSLADTKSALQAVSQASGSGDHVKITQDGVEGHPSADEISRLYVNQRLFGAVFDHGAVLETFDDGDILFGERLRDRMELGDSDSFSVKQSDETEEELEISL